MRLVIVTGMSGAGKSTAMKMLEDAQYFCVDNLPIQLVGKFVSLVSANKGEDVQNAAIGLDVRSGRYLEGLEEVLDQLKAEGYKFEILFLDADDRTLVKRYKETRRTYPLAMTGRVDEGIQKERECLSFLKEHADYIIDTTHLLTRELKKELDKIFVENGKFDNMMISVLSFGFKYGIPEDADLVFDVRFLPNPFYIPGLGRHTGLDADVRDFVLGHPVTQEFMTKMQSLLTFLIPHYQEEGKHRLSIAIGCTGGAHRSVAICEALAAFLREQGYAISVTHRDLELEQAHWKERPEVQ